MVILTLGGMTISAQDDAEAQIEELIDSMESAVLAQDAETYLSYVDLSDPVFAQEHTNWANEWANEDFLTGFSLDIDDIQVDDDLAIGYLELSWTTSLPEQTGQIARYWVQFSYDEDSDTWLFGGEYWETTETDNFVVHVAPNMEDAVASLLPILPDMYTDVTTAFEYTPQNPMEIKIYETQQALGATTLLSLPLIGGWNEPGESLKIIGLSEESMPRIVAHEFTHFLTFDQAGTAHGFMPWWLSEGIAEYLSREYAPNFDPDALDFTVLAIQGLHQDTGLVDWDEMRNFEETPVNLWGYVYPQGYTFVFFMSDTFGDEVRNEWLHLMAEISIEESTETVFGKSFDDLNLLFLRWLDTYPAED